MSEEETDWAWLAGFFDGEGNTSTNKGDYTNNRGFPIQVRVTQNDIRPIQKAQAIAGGNIVGPYKYGNSNSQPTYRWQLTSYDACVYALERMWPYLSEAKKLQAIEAFIQREIGRAERGIGQ